MELIPHLPSRAAAPQDDCTHALLSLSAKQLNPLVVTIIPLIVTTHEPVSPHAPLLHHLSCPPPFIS
ncbi:hypothetical protein BD626DRAFT_491254 [Schizophyllum amplum]|uniref:Uncharacterized protein n=1 Tax=Schizophyllum amplum TaxID=97359 RepID=A0A550BVK9_9AGAR|nr:hypothetical protein BD626DRAFT_518823 [Auriculariopsis ampla]TRM64257.1 hypothetical protein BD626DRAFT_491254 [Auriculariopsis ampla]